jgi:hypothetical protein
MGQSVFPSATAVSPYQPVEGLLQVPVGMTLQRTYTTTTSGITGLPSIV